MLWFSHAARGSARENPRKTPFTKRNAAFILFSKSVPADGGTMTVGQVIRQMREERGWNQAKLGVLSGTGPSGISQIETGRRNPSAATLERIAKALEVEVRELFPLAQAPLPLDVPAGGAGSPKLSLNDVIADLRRTTARNEGFLAIQQALDGFCEGWEKRLAEGDFDKAAIEEAGRTIKFFWPAVTAAADAEMVDAMRFITYEEATAQSKLFPAIRRFQALCDTVNSTYREKFLNATASNVYPFPQRKAS
jgi:transcriptional regulator with XRE-family HTH domain